MFNRKLKDEITRLQEVQMYLEERLKRCEQALIAVQPRNSYYSSLTGLSGSYIASEPTVTLQDLVDDFRKTHNKVRCSDHWVPKEAPPKK